MKNVWTNSSLYSSFFLAILILSIFLYYPLSFLLLFGKEVSLAYGIQFPGSLLCTTLGFGLLVFRLPSFHINLQIVSGIALIGIYALNSMLFQISFQESLDWLALPIIALTSSFTLSERVHFLKKDIPVYLTAFWLINVFIVLVQNKHEGLCGNINWLSAAVVGTAPWAIIVFSRIAQFVLPVKFLKFNTLISTSFCLIITSLVIAETRCRATILFFVIGCTWLLLRFSKSLAKKVAITCTFFALAVVAWLVFLDDIDRSIKADIRVPMWKSSLSMSSAAPIGGHGLSNFRARFPEFKSPEISKRPVAAAITLHPHNELLNVLVAAGLPAFLLWGTFIISILYRRQNSFTGIAAWWSSISLLVHGCFDKTLVGSPTFLLLPLMLGICLTKSMEHREAVKERSGYRYVLLSSFAFSGLVIFGVYHGFYRFQYHAAIRDFEIASAHARASKDSQEKAKYYLKAFDAATSASRTEVDLAHAMFEMAFIGSEYLQNYHISKALFEKQLSIEPNFGYSKYLYARCLIGNEQIYLHPERGTIRLSKLVTENIDTQPNSNFLYEDLINIYHVLGMDAHVVEVNKQLENRYRAQAKYNAHLKGEDVQSWVTDWRNSEPNGVSRMRESWRISKISNQYCQQKYEDFRKFNNYLSSCQYYEEDDMFWQNVRFLKRHFESDLSVSQLLKSLQSLKKIQQGSVFKYPADIWRNKEGSLIEQACLASFLLRMRGISNVISINNGIPSLLFYDSGTLTSVSSQTWTIEDSDITAPAFSFVFVLPEEFSQINHAIAALTNNSNNENYLACPLPTLARIRHEFPPMKFEFLKQPFEEFEGFGISPIQSVLPE